MGRKSTIDSSTDALHQTCADAARILAGDLAGFSAIMKTYLQRAAVADDERTRWDLLETANVMVTPMTQLAETIGKLKGQHIRVDRLAHRGEIDTESAPNSEGEAEEKPKESLENPPAD
jgi:hypothetical protein